MANMLDWNTVDHKVKEYMNPDSGIDTPQKAFPILMVSSILGISDEEAEDSITDGSMDRGCDAVFVDDSEGRNTIHVFQFKYVITFEKTKSNFPSGEIDKLVSFFDEVLDENKSLESTCNPILWNKVKEIWGSLNKPNPHIEVHFCSNTALMVPIELERANTTLGKYKYFRVNHHSLDTVIDLFVEKNTVVIDNNIQVVDKDYFDRTDGSIRGLICTVEALEIVRIISNPDNSHTVRKEIFNDNVRVYLNRSNKINRKIIESALSDDNPYFWYLNNGITITCDSFSYPKGKRAPIVELKNIQIVNGGQTSNALFEASLADPEKLTDVLILVRIIETKSQSVSLSIAESTNSQTPIKSRDLRSNDDTQKKLQEAFESMGLFYERKNKQYSDMPRSQRVDALSSGQAHLAYGLELPEVAKKDRGRIFSDLYDQVFSDDVFADELLASFKLLESIELEKRKVQASIRSQNNFDKSKMFLIDGAYHVLFALGQIADKNGINRLDVDAVKTLLPDAVELISNMVSTEQDQDASFSFNRYFKDSKTKTKIAARIKSWESASDV